MNLINKLSVEDKRKIKKYINLYNEQNSSVKDLSKVLSYWDKAKSCWLDEIFDGEMIISKEIAIEKSTDMIEADMNASPEFMAILDDFANAYYMHHHKYDNWASDRYILAQAFNTEYLAKNVWTSSYYDNYEYTIPGNDKPIKMQKGMKIIKLLAKVAEAIDWPLFEEFRILHSQFLNQKILKGELCLSIHPLDYMTMSDNESGWRSCMSWNDTGCYRSGTIEMMNSNCVIVAYLKAKNDMTVDGEKDFWNNKKWRTLIIADPNKFVTTVKSYPYESEELSKAALEFLVERMPCSWVEFKNQPIYGYHMFSDYRDEYNEINEKIHVDDYIAFETEYMYNDFGTGVLHYGIFPFDNITTAREYAEIRINGRKHYNYSGPKTCMICGNEEFYDDNSEHLCCGSKQCSPETWCESCGCHHKLEDFSKHAVLENGAQICDYSTTRYWRVTKSIFGDYYLERNNRYVFSRNFKAIPYNLTISETEAEKYMADGTIFGCPVIGRTIEVADITKENLDKLLTALHTQGYTNVDLTDFIVENEGIVEYEGNDLDSYLEEFKKVFTKVKNNWHTAEYDLPF
jgi:hypothetical protein